MGAGAAVRAGVAWLNGLAEGDAERELLACCASPRWVGAVVAGRPYRDRAALVARSDEVLRGLAWADVAQALAAHPRIGQAPAEAGRAADWSRGEQAGAASADEDTRAALAAGNAEYERRFGHVYLVCASGRTAGELLRILHERLGNDPTTERDVIREELAKITRLRLQKLVAP